MFELTTKQTAAIELIRSRILSVRYGHTAAKFEIKRFEITMPKSEKGLAFVFVECGMIGDEGTLAERVCRDRRHIMVGRNGGTELLNPRKKGRTINRGLWKVLQNLAD